VGKVIAAGVVPKLTQQQNVPVFIGKIEFSIHAFGPEHGKTLRCGVILKVIAKSGYLNGRSIAKGQKFHRMEPVRHCGKLLFGFDREFWTHLRIS
jgi:hypothetical protein